MLPMQQGPGSVSCMCWRPVCHALQHPAMPNRISPHGNMFSSGGWAALLSSSSAKGGACKGIGSRSNTLRVQRAAAMGMRVAPESLMRPAASPFGQASCANSAYHCGFASLAAALAANTAARPAQDHLYQIRTSPLTNDWTSALLQMHHRICPVIYCRSIRAPSAFSAVSRVPSYRRHPVKDVW